MENQLEVWGPSGPSFDGKTYVPVLDRSRLARQILRVSSLMVDGSWRTLQEIAVSTGDPESSVSARLRDLRKPRFGGHTVSRRRRGEADKGLFEYRLTVRTNE